MVVVCAWLVVSLDGTEGVVHEHSIPGKNQTGVGSVCKWSSFPRLMDDVSTGPYKYSYEYMKR